MCSLRPLFPRGVRLKSIKAVMKHFTRLVLHMSESAATLHNAFRSLSVLCNTWKQLHIIVLILVWGLELWWQQGEKKKMSVLKLYISGLCWYQQLLTVTKCFSRLSVRLCGRNILLGQSTFWKSIMSPCFCKCIHLYGTKELSVVLKVVSGHKITCMIYFNTGDQ